MARSSKLLLAVGLFALLALASAGPPLDAKDQEAKAARKAEARAKWEQRSKEHKENGAPGKKGKWGSGEGAKGGRHGKERFTPEMMEERRKASALFAAIVEPKAPKTVTFPLSADDDLKFHAAREGLMEWVHKESKTYDIKNEDTKKTLREKTTANQDKTRELLVAAVKSGSTLQQARVGLIIAQFESLDADTQKEALAKGKERMDKMPAGARDKAGQRQLAKHNEETGQLADLKTDAAKEEWVNKRYQPSVRKVPKMLE